MIFRFGIFTTDMNYVHLELKQLGIDIAIFIIVNMGLKLYNRVWTFASIPEMRDCFISATVTEALYMAYKMLFQLGMPRSYYPLNWLILVLTLCVSRVSIRVVRRMKFRSKRNTDARNIMIIDAGGAASMLI